MKKIRLYILDSSVDITGAFNCARNEAKLISNRVDTTIILPKSTHIENSDLKSFSAYDFLPILNLRKTISSVILYLPMLIISGWKLSRLLKKDGCEILQVNDFYMMHGVITRLFGYRGKIVTWVRIDPDRFGNTLKKIWLYFAYKTSDNVVAVSDYIRNKLPDSKKNIRIYDPVSSDIESMSNNTEKQSVNKIVHIANYIEGKGQDYALRAFKNISNLYPDAELHFYGGTMGLVKNQSYKDRLKKILDDKMLKKRVFFHDFVDNVSNVLNSADIALNFSSSESFSLTCLEASSHGVPVIATRCGGPEEIIADKKTGILVEIGNIEEMSSALNDMLSDSRKSKKMGNEGHKYVLKKFSPENFKVQINKLFGIL